MVSPLKTRKACMCSTREGRVYTLGLLTETLQHCYIASGAGGGRVMIKRGGTETDGRIWMNRGGSRWESR